MKRRLVSLLVALMLVLSICACAGEKAPEATKPVAENAGVDAGDADKIVKITFETCQYLEAPHKAAMDQLIVAFNEKYPNIQVEFFGTDYANYWTSLTNECMADNQGDIVQFHPMHLVQYQVLQEGGTFLCLDDYIKDTDFESVLTMQSDCKIDGKNYAVSSYAWGTLGMFYSKKLCKQFGIDPESIKTWEDFKGALATVREQSDEIYGLAAVTGTHEFVETEWHRWLARPVSGGIYFKNAESGPYVAENVNTNNEANIWAAYEWQKEIKEDRMMRVLDKAEGRNQFWSGYTVFNLDGPWFIGMTQAESQEAYDDLGVMPLPAIEYEGELKKPDPVVTPLICAISKSCENPDAAWTFLQFMATEGQQYIEDCGMIPTNTVHLEEAKYNETHPMAYGFNDYLQNYYNTPVHDPYIPERGAMQQIMVDAAQEMYANYADCKTTLDEAAEQIKALFQ